MALLDFITKNDFYFSFKKFRFVQNSSETVTLEAVVNDRFERKSADEKLKGFKSVCPDINLELCQVKDFAREKSGKSRIVVCRI
jgi:hypothetical protein